MSKLQKIQNSHDKISNAAQIGGIETAVLDNGAARGTRIAWINTGTGLRYKVVIDRAMDIAEAFFNEKSLAWLSAVGTLPPDRFSNTGIGWLRNFGGGLLTTCGLSHIGGPEEDEFGNRGLHGRISNTAAEIVSIVQPDPVAGKMDMSITGLVREAQVFGPVLELRRTISGRLGEAKINIRDEVLNRGNEKVPHMLLYHVNFGWPLIDEGTKLLWKGNWQARDSAQDRMIFNEDNDFRTCSAPMETHSGTGESVAFVDIEEDNQGMACCGVYNPKLDLALAMRFPKKELPWLTNWQHWGKNEYVTALEPGTHPPIGQKEAREKETLIYLEPGERRKYILEIEVLESEKLTEFVTSF